MDPSLVHSLGGAMVVFSADDPGPPALSCNRLDVTVRGCTVVMGSVLVSYCVWCGIM